MGSITIQQNKKIRFSTKILLDYIWHQTIGLLDNSRIHQLADCQLMDWTPRGLVNSWTRQLAD